MNTRNFSMALNIVLIFVVLCGLYFFRSDIFISKNNMIYDDSSTETLAKKENVDYKSLIGHKQHNWMPKIFIDKFEINMSLDAFIKLVDIQLKKEDFKRNLDTIFQFDTDRNALLSQLEIQQMNISDQAEINRYVDIINTFKRIDLNRDKKIDSAEIEKMATTSFATIDLNRDKIISREEKEKFFNESNRELTVNYNPFLEECSFLKFDLPKDTEIYAIPPNGAKKMGVRIDNSGNEAQKIDVVVNVKDKPVALIFSSYNPIVWDVSRTSETRIVAVIAGGYHNQIIRGIDKDTPKITALFEPYGESKNPCGYFYSHSENYEGTFSEIAQMIFENPVKEFVSAKSGIAVIGDQSFAASEIVHIQEEPIKVLPMAEKILEDAENQGFIRKASVADVQIWYEKAVKHKGHKFSTTDNFMHLHEIEDTMYLFGDAMGGKAYVILKDFIYPDGLHGAYSRSFILAQGVKMPQGDKGHSTLYDLNTLKCDGTHPVCMDMNRAFSR